MFKIRYEAASAEYLDELGDVYILTTSFNSHDNIK